MIGQFDANSCSRVRGFRGLIDRMIRVAAVVGEIDADTSMTEISGDVRGFAILELALNDLELNREVVVPRTGKFGSVFQIPEKRPFGHLDEVCINEVKLLREEGASTGVTIEDGKNDRLRRTRMCRGDPIIREFEHVVRVLFCSVDQLE